LRRGLTNLIAARRAPAADRSEFRTALKMSPAKLDIDRCNRSLIRAPARTQCLLVTGRQILIAAVDKIVQFNILEFYRGRHTYAGIDTLGFSSAVTADILRTALPGFASSTSFAVSEVNRAVNSWSAAVTK
jgi:hypothetical protein